MFPFELKCWNWTLVLNKRKSAGFSAYAGVKGKYFGTDAVEQHRLTCSSLWHWLGELSMESMCFALPMLHNPIAMITSTWPIAHHRWYSVFLSTSVSLQYLPWHEQAWRVSKDAPCKLCASSYCQKWCEGSTTCWGTGYAQQISSQQPASVSSVMLVIGDTVISYGLQLLIYSV